MVELETSPLLATRLIEKKYASSKKVYLVKVDNQSHDVSVIGFDVLSRNPKPVDLVLETIVFLQVLGHNFHPHLICPLHRILVNLLLVKVHEQVWMSTFTW